jgi:hypothetical protein
MESFGIYLSAALAVAMACAGPQATEHLCAVGQTAEVNGWLVTVHAFSILPGDDWRQPAEGHVFCTVELTLENHSGKISFFMPEKQMQLRDGNNRTYAPDPQAGVVAARSRQWYAPQGAMSIGEKAHGAVAYQLPTGSKGLRWVFRGGLLPWSKAVVFVLGDLAQ